MEIGIPTLIEANGIEDCAKLCKELELSFIEINMNMPEYQPEHIDTEEFLRVSRTYGIGYTIHMEESFNPCDFNAAVAAAYNQTAMQTIQIAKKLSVPIINIHMAYGVYFTLPEKRIYLYDKYQSSYLARLSQFREEVETAVGSANIKICIENCEGFTEFQKKGIAFLLESDSFALTLDIGHNAFADGVDEMFYDLNSTKLSHMHIHDAKNKKPHLPLGTGELDIHNYFRLAKERCCSVVLETKTVQGLKESAIWAKQERYITSAF